MICRIGILSDTHGCNAPAFNPEGVAAVLHAGDLYDAAADDAQVDDPLSAWLDQCSVPVYLVRGNHDWRDRCGWFKRYEDVTGRVVQVAPGLFVAGVGFSPRRYYDLPGETDLWPVCQDVLRMARRMIGISDRLILLTHYPAKLPHLYPADEGGPGWAFDCVRELIEELNPVAVVKGHVHEWFGRTHLIEANGGRVLLVHPGPLGGILEIDAAQGTASYAASRLP